MARTRIPVAAIYRQLLRTCSLYDANPLMRCALSMPLSGPTMQPAIPLFEPTAAGTVEHDIAQLVTGAVHMQMNPAGGDATEPTVLYRPDKYEYDSFKKFAMQVFRNAVVEEAVGADAALNAIRVLKHIAQTFADEAAKPDNVMPALHSSYGSGRGVGAINEASALSPGCLLVEHASVLSPGRTVALVYDISKNVADIHGNEKWMVRSFVVNRPFPASVATMLKRKDLGEFGSLTLFHGGSSNQNLAIIHCHKYIEGAAAVDESDTLFVGGNIASINAALAAGTASPTDFKVVLGAQELGLAGADDALALPEDDRYWTCGGPGCKDIALLPPQFDTVGRFRDGIGLGLEERVEGYNHGRYWHQNLAWAASVAGMAATRQPPVPQSKDMSTLHPAVLLAVARALPVNVQTVFAAAPPAAASVAPGLKERIRE